MVAVILCSKRLGINPDNVATPMAASFGDLSTLALLACFSHWFFSFIGKVNWIQTSQQQHIVPVTCSVCAKSCKTKMFCVLALSNSESCPGVILTEWIPPSWQISIFICCSWWICFLCVWSLYGWSSPPNIQPVKSCSALVGNQSLQQW